MKVKIKDIGAEGLDVAQKIDSDILGLTEEDYLQFVAPLDVSAHFEFVSDVVVMRAKVKSTVKAYCAITLKELRQEFKTDFTVEFEVGPNLEFIDVDDEIRQEVLLSLPVKLVSDDAPFIESSEDSDPRGKEKYDGPTYQPFADLPDIE